MSYIENVFLALDEFLNCLLFAGNPQQTISVHAALAARQGKLWGCLLCRILSALVQPNHCADSLTENATPTSAALKAGALLSAILVFLVAAIRYGIGLLSG